MKEKKDNEYFVTEISENNIMDETNDELTGKELIKRGALLAGAAGLFMIANISLISSGIDVDYAYKEAIQNAESMIAATKIAGGVTAVIGTLYVITGFARQYPKFNKVLETVTGLSAFKYVISLEVEKEIASEDRAEALKNIKEEGRSI